MRRDGVPDVPCFPGVVRAERCGRLALAADRDAGVLYAGDGVACAVSRFRRSGAAFAGAGDESGVGAVPHDGLYPFRDCLERFGCGGCRLVAMAPACFGMARAGCAVVFRPDSAAWVCRRGVFRFPDGIFPDRQAVLAGDRRLVDSGDDLDGVFAALGAGAADLFRRLMPRPIRQRPSAGFTGRCF